LGCQSHRGDDGGAEVAVRSENAVVANEVAALARDEGGEAFEEGERVEDGMGGAVAKGALERVGVAALRQLREAVFDDWGRKM